MKLFLVLFLITVETQFVVAQQAPSKQEDKKYIKENLAGVITLLGKETLIQKELDVTIDSVTYKASTISLMHFVHNQALLCIKIECSLPSELIQFKEFAYSEAPKLAKYLLNRGYSEKARLKTKEINRGLLDCIGVLFVDPVTSANFGVIVEDQL